MPYAYEICTEAQVTLFRLHGAVSVGELLALREEVGGDPDFNPAFHEIIDLRDVQEIRLTSPELVDYAAQTIVGAQAKSAFVVANEHVFGMVRMYLLAQSKDDDTVARIFWDMNEARAWIGLDPD